MGEKERDLMLDKALEHLKSMSIFQGFLTSEEVSLRAYKAN